MRYGGREWLWWGTYAELEKMTKDRQQNTPNASAPPCLYDDNGLQ